MNKLIT